MVMLGINGVNGAGSPPNTTHSTEARTDTPKKQNKTPHGFGRLNVLYLVAGLWLSYSVVWAKRIDRWQK